MMQEFVYKELYNMRMNNTSDNYGKIMKGYPFSDKYAIKIYMNFFLKELIAFNYSNVGTK